MTVLKSHFFQWLWVLLIFLAALLFIGAAIPQVLLPNYWEPVPIKMPVQIDPRDGWDQNTKTSTATRLDSIVLSYRAISVSA